MKVSVKMGRTINTGQYENKKIELGIEKDVRDDADLTEVWDEMMDKLEDRLDEEEKDILEEAVKGG